MLAETTLYDTMIPLTHADDEFKKSKLNGIFENQPTTIRHKSRR